MKGGKLPQTTRAYQLTVNHKRQILATTQGFPGRWNDKTVVRFDRFVCNIANGLLYDNIEYTLFDTQGIPTTMKGLWLLVDNGYLNWSCTVPPYKEAIDVESFRWSKWAESIRKDVECCFGILKGRWRILKTGVRIHDLNSVDDIWFTCCTFHNWLLIVDGLSQQWRTGAPSDYQGDMGYHEARLGQLPLPIQRLVDAGQFYTYDPTGMRYHETQANIRNMADPNAPIDNIRSLSLETFRKQLVVHFDYLWRNNMIQWPSRNGPN